MRIKFRKTWYNSVKKFHASPLRYVYAENLEDICKAVREAEAEKLQIRAVGSGHSFNDIACSNGIMVDICRLNRVLDEGPVCFSQPGTGNCYVEIEAGINIHDLYKQLQYRELSMINMGGIDNQTVAGAIATGTHGSGLGLPAVSGFVRSMLIVASGAKKFRIEPAMGISDPQKQKEIEPDVTLVQSDDDFYAALVNLGCFGIIYSYVMEVTPSFYIRESRRMEPWSKAKEMIKSGELFRNTRSFAMQINPYKVKYEGVEDHWCIFVKHRWSPRQYNWLGSKKRNLKTIIGNNYIAFFFGRAYINLFPKNTPKFLLSTLKSQKDNVFIVKSQKAIYQGAERLKLHAYDCESAFEYDADHFISVVEKIFKRLEEIKNEGHLYLQSPLGIRFVKPSRALLTPERNRFVFYIDTPVLNRSIGSDGLLDEMQDLLLAEGATLHWGKINNRLTSHQETIKKNYPRLNDWIRLMRKYNSNNLFNNSFTDRIGLTETPMMEKV